MMPTEEIIGAKLPLKFLEVDQENNKLVVSNRRAAVEKVFQPGQQVKCMIIDHDKVNGRIVLSTKTLEPEPGDMLKDPEMVFAKAEETAARYHEGMEAERKAREESGISSSDLATRLMIRPVMTAVTVEMPTRSWMLATILILSCRKKDSMYCKEKRM